MKKITIFLVILILSLNSTFAVITDITFHSKFEKKNVTNLDFGGYPAHSFKQHEPKYQIIEDRRKDEYTYKDAKKKYINQRKGKFSSSYEVSKYNYKFEKNYRDNQYKEYKRKYYSSNKEKINYFKSNGLKFKSSENHQINDY